MEQDKLKERIKEKVKGRMNKLFRRVLATTEQQTKDFGVNQEGFFKKDNKKGFGLVRKTVLDNGNEVLEYIDELLDMLNIEPLKATMEIPKKVMEDIEKSNKKDKKRKKGDKK